MSLYACICNAIYICILYYNRMYCKIIKCITPIYIYIHTILLGLLGIYIKQAHHLPPSHSLVSSGEAPSNKGRSCPGGSCGTCLLFTIRVTIVIQWVLEPSTCKIGSSVKLGIISPSRGDNSKILKQKHVVIILSVSSLTQWWYLPANAWLVHAYLDIKTLSGCQTKYFFWFK